MNSSGLVLDLPTSRALKDELEARKRYTMRAKPIANSLRASSFVGRRCSRGLHPRNPTARELARPCTQANRPGPYLVPRSLVVVARDLGTG